ncbi:MAG: WD40 repeat domain-containing protein [Reyranellaceae bacterium]
MISRLMNIDAMTQAFRVLVRRMLLIGVAIAAFGCLAHAQPSNQALPSGTLVQAANDQLDKGGDLALALALALEILPREAAWDDRPHLRDAIRIVQSILRRGEQAQWEFAGVKDVQFSPDGRRILIRTDAGAFLLEVASGEVIAGFSQSGTATGAHRFLPDGSARILTVSPDGTVAIRDITGQVQATLHAAGMFLTSSPDLDERSFFTNLATLGLDGSRLWTASPTTSGPQIWDTMAGRLWDAGSGKVIATIPGSLVVPRPAFSADGRYMAVATADASVRIIALADGATAQLLHMPRRKLSALALSPDGSRLLTASHDGTRLMWDVKSGAEAFYLPGLSYPIDEAIFSPDGRQIVIRGKDARLLDAGTGEVIRIFNGHQRWLQSVAMSADGAFILTTAANEAARLWSTSDGEAVAMLGVTRAVHPSTFSPGSSAFSPDGTHALTISHDRVARLWPTYVAPQALLARACSIMSRPLSRDERQRFSLEEDPRDPPCGWHPDMQVKPSYTPRATPTPAVIAPSQGPPIVTPAKSWLDLAQAARAELARKDAAAALALALEAIARNVPDAESTLRTIVYANAPAQIVLTGHTGWVHAAVFSPDGKRVLTGSQDSTARLWDTETGRELAVLRHPGGIGVAVAFSPDGRRVATASGGTDIRLWDATNGAELAHGKSAIDGGTYVTSLVFSADGRQILTASSNGTASVWDAATGREWLILDEHDQWLMGAVFSPDDKRILTVSQDTTARVWDAATSRELAVLKGHTSWIWSGRFSPDGRLIATASGDGTARLWDAVTFKELAVLPGADEDEIRSAAFSPDGRRLLTSGVIDGTPRIWEIPSGKLLARMYGHTDFVTVVAFSPDGSQALSVSKDATARLWHGTSGAPLAVLRGHHGFMTSAAFSPDGGRILTAGDNTARVWLNFRTAQELIDHACSIMSRPLSRDERRRFSLDEDPKNPPCGWHPDMPSKPPYTPKAAPR